MPVFGMPACPSLRDLKKASKKGPVFRARIFRYIIVLFKNPTEGMIEKVERDGDLWFDWKW